LFCDDFSLALVCVGDSQIYLQVPDSEPIAESHVSVLDVPINNDHVSSLVAKVATEWQKG
jgi:hypothetical protein